MTAEAGKADGSRQAGKLHKAVSGQGLLVDQGFHQTIHHLASGLQQSHGLLQGTSGKSTDLGVDLPTCRLGVVRTLVEPVLAQKNLGTS